MKFPTQIDYIMACTKVILIFHSFYLYTIWLHIYYESLTRSICHHKLISFITWVFPASFPPPLFIVFWNLPFFDRNFSIIIQNWNIEFFEEHILKFDIYKILYFQITHKSTGQKYRPNLVTCKSCHDENDNSNSTLIYFCDRYV